MIWLLVILLAGCTTPIEYQTINMSQLVDNPEEYLGTYVELVAWHYDYYAINYSQFADLYGNYIYVQHNKSTNFKYRSWYEINGIVSKCQISDSKERYCLVTEP